MASMYGYITAFVGLSILLAFAGVDTGVNSTMSLFNQNITMNTNGGNYTLSGVEQIDFFNSSFLKNLLVALAALTSLGLAIAAAKFDIAASLKVSAVMVIAALIINDFIQLLKYAQLQTSFGGIITLVSWILYLPLLFGFVATALNWIQGTE